MIEKIAALVAEYAALEQELSAPETHSNPAAIKRIGKRMAELRELLPIYEHYKKCEEILKEVEATKNDPELHALALEEAAKAEEQIPLLEEKMKRFLVPPDPDDDKSVILEIRAGTGGDEAALFAAELFRMYMR